MMTTPFTLPDDHTYTVIKRRMPTRHRTAEEIVTDYIGKTKCVTQTTPLLYSIKNLYLLFLIESSKRHLDGYELSETVFTFKKTKLRHDYMNMFMYH